MKTLPLLTYPEVLTLEERTEVAFAAKDVDGLCAVIREFREALPRTKDGFENDLHYGLQLLSITHGIHAPEFLAAVENWIMDGMPDDHICELNTKLIKEHYRHDA